LAATNDALTASARLWPGPAPLPPGLRWSLALTACGFFGWQNTCPPPRRASDELENDLRALVRLELSARQDSQVAALKAQIASLEARLAELDAAPWALRRPSGAAPETPGSPSAEAPRPSPPTISRTIAASRASRPRRAQRRRPSPGRPTGAFQRSEPVPPPRPLSQEDAIASLKSDVEYGRLLELYPPLPGRRAGRAGRLQRDAPAHWRRRGRRTAAIIEDRRSGTAIWFVEVAASDTHGVLLPARKAMRDWDKSYRPMSGHKATAVFGSATTSCPASRLSVADPAWARRTGPAASPGWRWGS